MKEKTEIKPEECMDWLYRHIDEYGMRAEAFHKLAFCNAIEQKNVYFHQALLEYEYFCIHTVRNPVISQMLPAYSDKLGILPLKISGYFMEIEGRWIPIGLLQEKGGFEKAIEKSFEQWKEEAASIGNSICVLTNAWEETRKETCASLRAEGAHCFWEMLYGLLTCGAVAFAAWGTLPYWQKVNWRAVMKMKLAEDIPWNMAKAWYYSDFENFDITTKIILACILGALLLAVKGMTGTYRAWMLAGLCKEQEKREEMKRKISRLNGMLKVMTWEGFFGSEQPDFRFEIGMEDISKLFPDDAGKIDTLRIKRAGNLRWLLLAAADAAIVQYLCSSIISLWR